MKITTVGIDLAKHVFQIHAVDERGKTVIRKVLKRDQVAAFFGNLPLCVDLARSSYFYHCARLRRPDKYADARVAMTDVFQSNHRCHGYRRIREALGQHQLHISEKVVQRLSPSSRCLQERCISHP